MIFLYDYELYKINHCRGLYFFFMYTVISFTEKKNECPNNYLFTSLKQGVLLEWLCS